MPCAAIRESSAYIRVWLERQPRVKEESLTDWILYDVSVRLSNVLYHSFTRHEEARDSGADWEWWFVLQRRAFCLRVQAKKLQTTGDNFPALAYGNRYGLQIEKLLDSAQRVNAAAVYAFYSDVRAEVLCQGMEGHPDGVFIADARRLHSDFISTPRKTVDARDLVARSNPLSCFLCCTLASRDLIDGFWHKYFEGPVATDENIASELLGVHDQLPSYLTALLEARDRQDNQRWSAPAWWEREYRSQLIDVSALVVHDLR